MCKLQHSNKFKLFITCLLWFKLFKQCFSFDSDDKSEGIEEKASPIKTSPPASPESRPVERQVEARNPEDSISSMVRCLYFATTYISDGKALYFLIPIIKK